MLINVDFIYPIGSIYITTSTVNPSISFGGTWEKITGDAYLKIVQNDASLGQYGGTSNQHKIPISSMPAHKHSAGIYDNIGLDNRVAAAGGSFNVVSIEGGVNVWTSRIRTNDTGGGQAYYPYYYGVYVWKRTA